MASTLKLRVVQARYGDCLILESGYGKRKKHILVDGGPGKVYRPFLRGELQRIAQGGWQIDLLVLSHIDNDHVLGLLELMTELKGQHQKGQPWIVPVIRIWHNAFKKLVPEAGEDADAIEEDLLLTPNVPEGDDPEQPVDFGVGEGVKLNLADELLGIPRNSVYNDGMIRLGQRPQPVRLAGIRMWILGPSEKNLRALKTKWVKWLAARRGEVSFDPEASIRPDDSVNNLSSIMFLAEQGGRRILMTGDGRSQDIIEGLEAAGLLPPGGTMHVDVMKVPHHGSARNCVGDLFDRVQADVYVLSADGRHGNPDKETLAWLVDAACRQNRDIEIFATNWTKSLEELLEKRPEGANHYRLRVMEQGKISEVL